MSETAAKRLKTSPLLIGTHNGHFHADEALAVYLLRTLPAYNPSTLVRTRDPSLLSNCHTVVDVGGEYSPSANRYDHHQRTFTTTFPSRNTKLSSAGLIYLHFGKAIVAQRTGLDERSEEVKVLWEKVYAEFVEALDAHDNGISVYDPAEVKGVRKRFYDGGINLGSLVGDLNDHWEDDAGKSVGQLQQEEDERFVDATKLMGTIFLRRLDYFSRRWLPARKEVYEVYAQRRKFDGKGRLLMFDKGVPWKDHLYALEDENPGEEKVVYVLYPEGSNEGSKWRIQAVSASKDSFESRKALPEAWRGVRDEELDGVTGIKGCVFVHASGFIGGNTTREGAMEMAKKAIEM